MGGSILLYNDAPCDKKFKKADGSDYILPANAQAVPLDAQSTNRLAAYYDGDVDETGKFNFRETAEWNYDVSDPNGAQYQQFWFDVSWITGAANGLTMGKQGGDPSALKGRIDLIDAINAEWKKEYSANPGKLTEAAEGLIPNPIQNPGQDIIAFNTPSCYNGLEQLFQNARVGGYVGVGAFTDTNGNNVAGRPVDDKESGDPLALTDTLEIHFGSKCPTFQGVHTVNNMVATSKEKRDGQGQCQKQKRSLVQKRSKPMSRRRDLPVEPPVSVPTSQSYTPAYAALGQGHSLAGTVGPYAVGGMILLLLLLVCSLIRDNSRLRSMRKQSLPVPDIKVGHSEP